MRKVLLAFAASLLTIPSAAAQQGRVEFRRGDAFHGPVKTVRMERAEFIMRDGEPVEGERRLVAVINYTPDGKRSEKESYLPDGKLRQKSVHVYDDGGDLVEEEHYDGEKALLSKKVYVRRGDELWTYDGDGKLLQRRLVIWNATRDKMIETREFDGGGALTKRGVNTRDPATGNSTWTYYRGDGSLAERNEFSPFTATKNDRQSRFRPDGTSAGRRDVKVERTANGMDIEATGTNPDGTVRRRTRETREKDARRNLVRQTHFRWVEGAGKFVPFGVNYNVITYF